jgi:putative membrane protein
MSLIGNIIVGLVALLHVYILILEMFLWEKPAGLKAFRQTKESAAATKVLAANQGLYNGFLAAGLFWGLSLGSAGHDVKVFFSLAFCSPVCTVRQLPVRKFSTSRHCPPCSV